MRHGIKGQIYRFYYKLSYDLHLNKNLGQISRPLPKGSLILLHSIIKYKMRTLVNGIETSGLFKVKYDPSYHQIVDTLNGKREYAIFSAYLEN
jgi:ABC-type transport system involved in Fe-S cluster assembly fused permease/ATPase subunit